MVIEKVADKGAVKVTDTRKEARSAAREARLSPGSMLPEGYVYERLSAIIPVGTAFEDILNPSYWANVTNLFQANVASNEPDRSGAIIVARTEDHSWYAHLYVRAVLPAGLIVSCIGPAYDSKGNAGPVDIETGKLLDVKQDRVASEEDDYNILWNVGRRGFDVIRKRDETLVAHSLKTREAAREWVRKAKS